MFEHSKKRHCDLLYRKMQRKSETEDIEREKKT